MMAKSRFTESQMIAAFKEVDAGHPVKEVCLALGISRQTYYAWRAKYRGMDAPGVMRLRELEVEYGRLKRMYAELAMENHALRAQVTGKDERNQRR
jgi:putative transposase